MAAYEDSHLRCPFDGKRMMVEIGPDEDEDARLNAEHECWHCGYLCAAPRVVVPNPKRIYTGRSS